MMKNFGKMMQQAQQMQTKMQEMQDGLAAAEVDGQAAGGMIKITVTGKGDVKAVKIDPSLVVPDDVEVLEDLILAACNDARGKVEELMQEKMREITGGMELPKGMSLPF